MRNKKLVIFLMAFLVVFVVHSAAASEMKNHSFNLSFKYGKNAGSKTVFPWGGPMFPTQNSGLSGEIGYNHFLNENLALVANMGFLYSSSQVAVLSLEKCSIMQMELGVKYYPQKISWNSALKFFLNSSAGFVTGSETQTMLPVSNSHRENAAAIFLGGGFDIILGPLVKMTLGAGYRFMSDFSKPLSGKTNYSGPQISLGIGFMF